MYSMLLVSLIAQVAYGNDIDDLKEYLHVDTAFKKLREEIADLDISEEFKVFNSELLTGVSVDGRYNYKVRPSYNKGLYSRVDRYRFNLGLSPMSWIGANLPISFGIGSNTEAVFVRQFKKQKDALFATPYTPLNLPINAEKARKLNDGDFVSIPISLNLSIGRGEGIIDNHLHANAGILFIWSGAFRLDIQKMKNDYVRMKVIALRSNGKSFFARLDLGIDIFRVEFENNKNGNAIYDKLVDKAEHRVKKRIKKIIDLNLLSFGFGESNTELFMVDYIFDLKDKDARIAYDRILASTYRFKRLETLQPFKGLSRLKSQVLSDITTAEEIAKKDSILPLKERRVHRVFKGNDHAYNDTAGIKLGNNLLRVTDEKTYSKHNISSERIDGDISYYQLDTTRHTKGGALLWVFKTDTTQSLSTLIKTNEKSLPSNFVGLTYIYDVKDSKLSRRDIFASMAKIQSVTPAPLFQRIDWGQWRNMDRIKSARIYFQIRFKLDAFLSLPYISFYELERRFIKYIFKLEKEDKLNYMPHSADIANCFDTDAEINHCLDSQYRNPENRGYPDEMSPGRAEKFFMGYRNKISSMLNALAAITTDRDKSLMGRQKKFTVLNQLRDNLVFINVGLGFLVQLLPKENVDQLVTLKLEMSGKKVKPVKVLHNPDNQDALFDQFTYVQGILNSREHDARSMDTSLDTLGEFYRKMICHVDEEEDDCYVTPERGEWLKTLSGE